MGRGRTGAAVIACGVPGVAWRWMDRVIGEPRLPRDMARAGTESGPERGSATRWRDHDVVAGRANQKLAAGEAVQAIQLAEIVLTTEPLHRGALEVSLAAHEALDLESVNFWLSSWLRKQTDHLRELLGVGEGA